MSTEAGPVGLVVLQSTGFCNIDCAYCYLPDRTIRKAMDLATVGEAARLIFDRSLVTDKLDVVWHAGEPLTLSPTYYARAIEILERARPRGVAVHYGIQTNGTLIDDAWIDLFEAHRIKIGISLDGPRDLHDRNRRYRNGAGSYDRVIAGIGRLQARGYPFHFIGVMTAASLSRAADIVSHYRRFGPTAVGFNVEEIEATNTRSSLDAASGSGSFERFITELLREAATSDPTVVVRDFQRAMSALIAGKPADNDQVIPLRIVNIASNGDIGTFSPELLALGSAQRRRFIFGNVHRCGSLRDILEDERFIAAHAEISRGVANCAAECKYFQYCGGGAPVNKLCEKGSMEATETMYCLLTKQAWINVALSLATAPENRFELSPAM